MTDGWINSLAASKVKFDVYKNVLYKRQIVDVARARGITVMKTSTRDSIIKSIEKSFVEEFE